MIEFREEMMQIMGILCKTSILLFKSVVFQCSIVLFAVDWNYFVR